MRGHKGEMYCRFRALVWFFVVIITLFVPGMSFADQSECTLEPRGDSEEVQLTNGVVAHLESSACTSLVVDVVFSPVNQSLEQDPRAALRQSASLVDEFQRKTGKRICPFDGDVSTRLKARADQEPPYRYGEDIPISNTDVPAWDAASVSYRREKSISQIIVHYRSNP